MKSIPTPAPRPYRLSNPIQPYAWGTRGDEAFIPRLLGIPTEVGTPYAELWMGAHPKAPSQIILERESFNLNAVIQAYPVEILGEAVAAQFGAALPFLFKVLSAGEPLSIQVHPNKAQAEMLHARDPEHYPDDNHKPEAAVALDSLTALVGFKAFPELVQTLTALPELATFLGEEVVRNLTEAGSLTEVDQRTRLQELYTTLNIRAQKTPEALEAALGNLTTRLSEQSHPTQAEQVFLKARAKYGADVGLFSIFLLNLVQLRQGEAIYTTAGVPHAYLEGNIVECMANSDNVVRAGLTPKYRDVETLTTLLTYEMGFPPVLSGAPDAGEIIYETPAKEFRMHWGKRRAGEELHQKTWARPQIVLVTAGTLQFLWPDGSETLTRGQSVLIPACLPAVATRALTACEFFRVTVPQ